MQSKEVFFSLGAVPTPMHLAVHKRWIEQSFQAKGVTIHNLLGHPLGDVQHFNHRDERHFREGGAFSAVWAHANGADTQVISLFWVPSRTDMLVPAASPLQSPTQLKGLRLSLPVRDYLPVDYPRASAYYAYTKILEAHGIESGEVSFVPVPVKRRQHAQQEGIPSFLPHHAQRPAMPQREEAEMLLAGKTDVMLTQLGRGLLYLRGSPANKAMRSIFTAIPPLGDRTNFYSANAYPVITTVNREFVAERPDLVRLWLRLQCMAALWSRDNHADHAGILASMTDIPVSLLNAAYAQDFQDYLLPDMEEDGLMAVAAIKAFLLQHGLLTRDFDVEEWFAPDFLSEVRREMLEGATC